MINLFINPYTATHPARQAELDNVARRNRASKLFGGICHVRSPYAEIRPTFADFFAATAVTDPDDINVIANADIFFDRTLRRVLAIPAGRWCLALSRWEWNGQMMGAKPWRGQDAWIFRGPVTGITGADFGMGIPGCDNRIAQLIQDAGYTVTNPCYSIHAIHHHRSAVRTYDSTTPAVPGPYLWVPCGDLAGRIDKTPEEYAEFAAQLRAPPP